MPRRPKPPAPPEPPPVGAKPTEPSPQAIAARNRRKPRAGRPYKRSTLAVQIDWRRKIGKPVPFGQGPFVCDICRDAIVQGQFFRKGGHHGKMAHEDCARKWGEALDGKGVPMGGLLEKSRKIPDELRGTPEALHQLSGEPDDQYRSFLLWAMQHPEKRTLLAVSQATGLNANTTRRWCRIWSWSDRVRDLPRHDAVAVDLYRARFWVRFARSEIPEVFDNVVVPIGTLKSLKGAEAPPSPDAVPTNAVPPLTDAAVELRGGVSRGDKAVAEEIRRKHEQRTVTRGKHLQLVDATLGGFAHALKDGKIRFTVADLPALLRVRSQLEAEQFGAELEGHTGPATAPAPESLRVRQAKATGGDVLGALYEDAQEFMVILGALHASSEAGAQAVPAGPPGRALRVVGGEDEDE